MKRIVEIKGERYYVHDKDDLIFLTHMLAKQNYTLSEIAYILGISRQKVIQYLQDCW